MKKSINILLTLFFSLTFFTVQAQYDITFTQISYGDIALSDYNNDGFQDILLTGADKYWNPVSKIYKNNGDGTFSEQTQIDLYGVYYSSVAWGDYNNDGYPDILISGDRDTDPCISVIYKNNGDGTFTEQTGITLPGVKKGSVSWCDYNNDGYSDILLTGADENWNPVSKIYKNNGNGTFSDINAGLTGVLESSVAWDDYNNDGFQDILLTGKDQYNYVISKVYKNNGDGTFSEQTQINLTGVFSGSAAWGDYNNDGFSDILLTGSDENWHPVSKIYKNNGNETFTEQTQIDITNVRFGSVACWGDYNNDNYLDILLTGKSDDGEISEIYKNNGNETFTKQTQINLTGVSYSSAVWGDINNDNYSDIVISGEYLGNKITKLYINNETGNFYDKITESFPEEFSFADYLKGIYESCVLWGDFDNDMLQDILLTGTGENNNGITKVYKNHGADATFVEQKQINLPDVRYGSAAWSDYNNDNLQDILLTGKDENDNVISKIYKNNGDGTFSEQTGIYLEGVYNSSVAWGDYNNDNFPDILLTGRDKRFFYISKIYKNNGDGTFSEQTGINLTGVETGSVAWKDYNNDGFQDILLTGEDNSDTKVSIIYKNNGDGTFTDINAGLTGVSKSSVAWGDYNNDGFADILLTGSDENWHAVSIIYKNNGDDTFTDINAGLTDVYDGSAAWKDYNNDGFQDILLTGSYISKVYKNNGDGTFTDINAGLKGVYSSSSSWGDFNNDGFADILLTGRDKNQNLISEIYRNKGDGTFVLEKQPADFEKISNSFVLCADFDKNGYSDQFISGLNTDNKAVSYMYNNSESENTKAETSFLGLQNGAGACLDFNNDGFIDIIISGKNNYDIPQTQIYENGTNGVFMNNNSNITSTYLSSVDCADYNNDGLTDIIICGKYDQDNYTAKVYKNTGDNNFKETNINIPPSEQVAWADFDNDNDFDICLESNDSIMIYENKGNETFIKSYKRGNSGNFIVTDYDNDGLLDIIYKNILLINKGNLDFRSNSLSGLSSEKNINISATDYDNNGKTDILVNNTYEKGYITAKVLPHDSLNSILIPGTLKGTVAVTDWDNDTDLDFMITGSSETQPYFTGIVRNHTQIANTRPGSPSNLRFFCSDDTVFISWDKATDNETPQDGLTYNCYMYEIGGDTIWHSLSVQGVNNTDNGKRYILKPGNVGHNTSWFIHGLDVTKQYAWSVQAIDNGFAAGRFAPEDTFRLAPAFVIQPVSQTVCEKDNITFNTSATTAISYQWYRFTETDTILIENNEYYSNATTPNLTVKNATLGMNGYELHCAATTVGGTTYSNPAILTVDTLILADAGED
ncbi:MAG: hypothetical protein GXO50_07455, partial [Chlorobi bacterium]|nr:hypothetical protein [Chlorobiota bacterium]